MRRLAVGIFRAVVIAGCATEDGGKSPATALSMEKNVHVHSGKQDVIGDWYTIFPTCKTAPDPSIIILTPPLHGMLSIEKGETHSEFPETDARHVCNAAAIPATRIYYLSNSNYYGDDSFKVKVAWKRRQEIIVDYHVVVLQRVENPQAPERTRRPLRINQAHPPRIGNDYYPSESKRIGEEGRCIVQLTVNADGTIQDVSLVQSSGFVRLDDACLLAFPSGSLIPATLDGKPVSSTVQIPVVWALQYR